MVIIEIDTSTQQAQKIVEMLETFPFVKVKEDRKKSKIDKPYNKFFVKKILRRAESAKNGNSQILDDKLMKSIFKS